MSRKSENTSFICAQCGTTVPPVTNGSYRNHCPNCLWSLHVDNMPGDRENKCCGQMRPINITYSTKKGYQIQHICERCGAVKANKIACNTNIEDDLEIIIKLMKEGQK